ncbi:L-serine ammonia-lyase, iron-sulfur-dependent subunit beta [Xanthovirga aplysinae]|uniref:L-serine ammonia-lyase, iron-sulfur-dependent subunit beta n=1 Tax=Xanthovirga aplysinae TaxID=2529853 RepID=UPI0012BB9051|nr:L-serine ammonia-lyase, iron-sulfur-dependent subunit beta [Xanthovirga aplysinae]MTI30151.1 L-serine ammonia-lyase, iron-sulfur-dependent, subunit beta [Xanthovirga aplysinae]
MAERSSVFDMIGPVMIGPSSSHTAGVVRIARAAIRVLGDQPEEAEITFYNSFAQTYEGHGSDRAIIAGLLDFKTDDKRIKKSLDHAKEKGLKYTFKSVGNASTFHPNTIRLVLKSGNKEVEVIGESRGGGVIRITEVNGFTAGFSANLHTIIITADDRPGSIAFIADVISQDGCNIATMSVSRKGKNDIACQVLEMDSGLRPLTIEYLNSLNWVHNLIYIPNID